MSSLSSRRLDVSAPETASTHSPQAHPICPLCPSDPPLRASIAKTRGTLMPESAGGGGVLARAATVQPPVLVSGPRHENIPVPRCNHTPTPPSSDSPSTLGPSVPIRRCPKHAHSLNPKPSTLNPKPCDRRMGAWDVRFCGLHAHVGV